MVEFFETKLEAEYQKERLQDKQKFERKVRQNAGINKMVTKLLNPDAGHPHDCDPDQGQKADHRC